MLQPENKPAPPSNPLENLPSPDHLARLKTTQTVREILAVKHTPPASPRSPFSLIERPDDYVQDFDKSYFPPNPSPSIEFIEQACHLLIGKGSFEKYSQVMLGSKGFYDAVEVIRSGGKIAIIAPHEQLTDTGIILANFIYCYHKLHPENWQERVQRSRTFVGPIIEELELRNLGISAMEALGNIGGTCKVFPQTVTTEEQIKLKLIDREVMSRTNRMLLRTWKAQSANNEFDTVSLSPSGKTDVHDIDANKEPFHILHPVSSGTTALLGRENFHILPTIMQLHPKPGFAVGELINPGRNLEDVMEGVLVPMSVEISGIKNTIYERREIKLVQSVGGVPLSQILGIEEPL